MAYNSNISWTDATWNPVRGCTKVSPGCANCYAEAFAERWRGIPGHPFEHGFDLTIVPKALELPMKWRKPRRIFVNSMSDLFHGGISWDYILSVCDVMSSATWHTFQVLTKRADRMSAFLQQHPHLVRQHIWWGVSVENRKHGLPRIDTLRRVGVKNAFVSFEPLLEDLGVIDLTGISWAIVGGESGPKRRDCGVKAILSIVDQCRDAGVPCFVKQDCAMKPGTQGRIPDDYWAVKQFPAIPKKG